MTLAELLIGKKVIHKEGWTGTITAVDLSNSGRSSHIAYLWLSIEIEQDDRDSEGKPREDPTVDSLEELSIYDINSKV